MKLSGYAAFLILANLSVETAAAAPMPEPVRAMIEAALASEDAAKIAAVADVARQTNPDSGPEIDAMLATHRQRLADQQEIAETARRERLDTAGIFNLWTGQVELGGSRSTGNTRNLGIYGAAKLQREGLDWKHLLSVRIDYQETNGTPTTERVVAAWQPRYSLSEQNYAFGLLQYERDRFLGYDQRYTVGLGIGVVPVETSTFRLEMDAGPVLRITRFGDDAAGEKRIAGRGSLGLKWTPRPRLSITQDFGLYVETGNTSVNSTTALETVLFGPLKGQLSYNVQYERNAPTGLEKVDTVSRASLVYQF